MKTFNELVIAYNEWRNANAISTSLEENIKYIWILPTDALNEWAHELDDKSDIFNEEELANYTNMFTVGNKILGITLAATDNSNIVKLYRLTTYNSAFLFENVLCSVDGNIRTKPNNINISDTDGNSYSINLPVVVQPKSIQFDKIPENNYDGVDVREGSGAPLFEDIFDGVDQPFKNTRGIISGKGYTAYQNNQYNRDSHRLININTSKESETESIFGAIDYSTGNIHLVRSFPDNEEKFITYYDELEQLLAGGGSGESSESGSSTTPMFPPPIPYTYVNISGTFIELGEPAELVFEFNITDE